MESKVDSHVEETACDCTKTAGDTTGTERAYDQITTKIGTHTVHIRSFRSIWAVLSSEENIRGGKARSFCGGSTLARTCSLNVIRRFINRSWRFMDAYRVPLSGKAAAWAVRKQKGRRRAHIDFDKQLVGKTSEMQS